MHYAKQAGLNIFANGDQYNVVVIEPQFFQGGLIGNIGNNRMGKTVGVFVDYLGAGVDAQHRMPKLHQFERGGRTEAAQTYDGKLCHVTSLCMPALMRSACYHSELRLRV